MPISWMITRRFATETILLTLTPIDRVRMDVAGRRDRYISAGCLGEADKMPVRCHIVVMLGCVFRR